MNRQAAQAAEFGPEDARAELKSIASWWLRHSRDERFGGFAGEIDTRNRQVGRAGKAVVLNSRILWFFSELCLLESSREYRECADRAFHYLFHRFDDRAGKGAVWTLTHDGEVDDRRKWVYAQAFCIYAFSAYYRLTSDARAIDRAMEYFRVIEANARDRRLNGYFEGFSADWQKLECGIEAAGDMYGPRPMNTHLHVLEAYSGLHRANPSPETADALRNIITLFLEKFFNPASGHLINLFDSSWNVLSSEISYGHDIEASWLLWEAASVLGEDPVKKAAGPVAGRLAATCLAEGLGTLGQVCRDRDPWTRRRTETGIWWIQAEAIAGFLNAWRLSGNESYRSAVNGVWRYIFTYLKDSEHGEWYSHPPAEQPRGEMDYKAGAWKGPYHNGRAMIEACRLLGT